VGAHLDGRLADLECRLGRRALTLLGDEDGRVRPGLLELKAERQARQSAAEDGDVVSIFGCGQGALRGPKLLE